MNSAYKKFNEIKTAYLSSLQTIAKSKATYLKYSQVVNDFAQHLEQNDCEHKDITAVQILNYSKAVKERGIKNNTLRHYLIVLRTFFAWCINHKFYAENPVLEEDIPKQERIDYDLLTEEEVNRILSGELPPYTQHPERTKAIIFTFLLTGLRVSELINLRIGDLDFIEGVISVVGKGNKLRTTTLPQQLIKVLQPYLTAYNKTSKTDLLFDNGKGKSFTRQNITKVVEGYAYRLLGHRHIGAHDLRHAFASLLLTQGAKLEQIQYKLGHSSYATTVIYASHLAPNRATHEMNSLLDNLPIFANA